MSLIALAASQGFFPSALWEQLVKILGSELSKTLLSYLLRQLLAVFNLYSLSSAKSGCDFP